MPTISSSFTVNTLDEPVSVVAQYAPNSNPTSSQIHDTWQSGDLYMRTRYTNSLLWSNWMKIVGENGSETDFSFAISIYKTTANSSTPPSDVSSWADAPMNITAAKPYLWSRVQQKAWNESTQSYVVQSTSYIRLTGEDGADGKNAVRIDLSNQADMIACDADGKILYNRTITTIAKIYDGAAVAPAVDSVTNPVLNVTRGGSTVNVASRGAYSSGVVIQFSFQEGDILSNVSSSVDITITYHSVNYTATFSLTRTDSTAIYQLLPSMLEIPFSVDSSNVYQPEYQRIDCGYTKTEANNTQSFAGNVKNNTCKPTAPYNILFRYQNADRTYTDGWKWMKDQPDSGSGTRYIQVGRDTAYIAIEFILTSADSGRDVSDSNIIDRETVPIIKSGKKGDTGAKGDKGDNGADGVSATVTPSSISVQCNTSGAVKTSVSQNLSFGLKVGTQSCSNVTAVQKSGTTLPTGVTLTTSSGKVTSITIGTTATASGLAAGVTFTVSGTYNSVGYSSECTLALIGALQGQTGQGERGKTGRFYYYAGEFDANNNTDTFSVSDIQVPFFSHGTNEVSGLPNCHLFDYDTNGSYTMYRMWQISGGGNWNAGSWNNAPWAVMWNDQKYLITEAVFGNYAHFASAIITGDYLISQYVDALGFGGMSRQLDDNSKYIYVDTDDMFGEDSMYDDLTKFPINESYASSLKEITSTSYSSNPYTSQFDLKWEGGWYCVDIRYLSAGGNLEFKIATSASATPIYEDTLQQFYVNDYTYEQGFFMFPCTPKSSKYRVYFRKTSSDQTATGEIYWVRIRQAKFVPRLCQDMKSGKIATRNIIAKGELHAESLYYETILGAGNGGVYRIENEAIVALAYNSMGSKIILPNPDKAKGRVIEIYSGIQDGTNYWFKLGYDAATSSTYFKNAIGSAGNYALANYSVQWKSSYIKLWCDGEYWYVLKDEHTVWVNDANGYRICLNNKIHV